MDGFKRLLFRRTGFQFGYQQSLSELLTGKQRIRKFQRKKQHILFRLFMGREKTGRTILSNILAAFKMNQVRPAVTPSVYYISLALLAFRFHSLLGSLFAKFCIIWKTSLCLQKFRHSLLSNFKFLSSAQQCNFSNIELDLPLSSAIKCGCNMMSEPFQVYTSHTSNANLNTVTYNIMPVVASYGILPLVDAIPIHSKMKIPIALEEQDMKHFKNPIERELASFHSGFYHYYSSDHSSNMWI